MNAETTLDGVVRVLICGDRNWTQRGRIREALRVLKRTHGERLVIVHGANGYDADGRPSYESRRPTVRGADMIAHDIALEMGVAVDPHPADWSKHGRAAGPIRNAEMLTTGLALVIAFHDDIDSSKGTKDMVDRARSADLPAIVQRRVASAPYTPKSVGQQ